MKTDNLTFKSLENNNIFELINVTRKGIDYNASNEITASYPLNISTWSRI